MSPQIYMSEECLRRRSLRGPSQFTHLRTPRLLSLSLLSPLSQDPLRLTVSNIVGLALACGFCSGFFDTVF